MTNNHKARYAVLLTVFIDLLGFGIVIPILPLYAKQVALNPSGWMSGINAALGLNEPGVFWAGVAFLSFSVMQFIATPILGRISDLVGRKPVLWVSLLGSALGYLILGLTLRFEWVLAARLLDGITGGNISVAQAAMADGSKPEERSKVLGMLGAAFGLGFVLGPAMAGLLSGTRLGVHLPFFVAGGLSFLASLMVAFLMPETLTPELREKAKRQESRGHALLRALERSGMPQLLSIALLQMASFAMMEGTFSLMAEKRFGFGQREVGFLFGYIGILIVIYQGGLVRVVSKRIPERSALIVGLLLMACGLYFLPRLGWMTPFLLALIPLAWGSGMNQTAASALASRLTPPEDQGGLFGVLNAMQGLGRMIGPIVGTFAFAKWGFKMPYNIAVITMLGALAMMLMLPRARGTASAAP
jgi:MFS transporter, DHA1 family, tetracycline resistance protein